MTLGSNTYIPLDPKVFTDNNELNDFKQYILRQLGWPLIRVEITHDQLTDCILDAVQLFHDFAALDYAIEEVSGFGGNTVTIPNHIQPKHIVEIIFERDYYDSLSAGMAATGFEETLGGVLPYSLSGRSSFLHDFDIAGYYLYLQHMEDFKKVLGIKRHFEIIGGEIKLFPANLKYRKIGILYKPMLDEKGSSQYTWIKQYAVAKAKIIVGTIRSKLGGFSSTGTNIAVDGDALKSEGREDINRLEEELKFLGPPMPFIQA